MTHCLISFPPLTALCPALPSPSLPFLSSTLLGLEASAVVRGQHC